MQRYAALLVGLALAVPVLGFAQAGGVPAICSVTRTLLRGSRGNDVSVLQSFLREQNYFKATPTGFFGPLTAQALIQFQLRKGIVARAQDGGAYGPKTRSFVKANWCLTPATRQNPAVAACLNPPRPTLSCDGTWQQFFDAAGCHTGWTCVVSTPSQTNTPAPNKPPLISAIVGPTSIRSGESGTWSITASDPENDQLTYSVVWGDEGANVATLLNISQEGTPYTTSTVITHKYANTGSYTIVVFAKDTAGNIVKATLAVAVYEPPAVISSTSSNSNPVVNGSGKTYACYVDGEGMDIDTPPASCGGSSDLPPTTECKDYNARTPHCTAQGLQVLWAGGYMNYVGVTVACRTGNAIPTPYGPTDRWYIPGNMRVQGSRCTTENHGQNQNCEAYYVCKRDGWWRTDSQGFELEKVSAPWILPEQFYPQF